MGLDCIKWGQSREEGRLLTQNPLLRIALRTKCRSDSNALTIEEKRGPQTPVRGPSEANRITSKISLWKCRTDGNCLRTCSRKIRALLRLLAHRTFRLSSSVSSKSGCPTSGYGQPRYSDRSLRILARTRTFASPQLSICQLKNCSFD